jgi:hypothetical protein
MRWSNWLWHAILLFSLLAVSSLAQPAIAGVSTTAPGSQNEPKSDPIKPIIDAMQGAGTRLKQGDTGPNTRTLQEKVIDDLQKLIDAAKPKSGGDNQQQKQESRRESGSQNQSGQPQGKSGAKAGSEPMGGGQPGRKSGMGKPSVSEKKAAARPPRPLLREVWGHLPPALRERVPSDFHEVILPAYDDLVRRYFEAILDGPSAAGARLPDEQKSRREPLAPGSPAQ